MIIERYNISAIVALHRHAGPRPAASGGCAGSQWDGTAAAADRLQVLVGGVGGHEHACCATAADPGWLLSTTAATLGGVGRPVVGGRRQQR